VKNLGSLMASCSSDALIQLALVQDSVARHDRAPHHKLLQADQLSLSPLRVLFLALAYGLWLARGKAECIIGSGGRVSGWVEAAWG
jgi:hypothetical protein